MKSLTISYGMCSVVLIAMVIKYEITGNLFLFTSPIHDTSTYDMDITKISVVFFLVLIIGMIGIITRGKDESKTQT